MIDKPKVQTAGIAIDSYKLETFERVITDAGYKFTITSGLAKDTLMLRVKTDNILALKEVVERANKEASKWRK